MIFEPSFVFSIFFKARKELCDVVRKETFVGSVHLREQLNIAE